MDKSGSHPMELSYVKAPLLQAPAYTRPGWEWLTVSNILAHYDIAKVTTVKYFIVSVTDGSDCKLDLNSQSQDTLSRAL